MAALPPELCLFYREALVNGGAGGVWQAELPGLGLYDAGGLVAVGLVGWDGVGARVESSAGAASNATPH